MARLRDRRDDAQFGVVPAAVHAANLRTVFDGFSRKELAVLDGLLDRLRAVPTQG